MSSASASRRSASPRSNGKGPARRSTKKPSGRRSGSPIKQPWLVYLILGAAVIALVVLAITSLGTSTSSARTETETVTSANGVVQETASGSGNVEAGVDDEVNFQTSGDLAAVYVKQGQTVKKGQLLAKLDPSSAELTLEEAEANLTTAEDTLTTAEDNETDETADDNVSATTVETADDTSSSDTGETVLADYKRAADTPTDTTTTTDAAPTTTSATTAPTTTTTGAAGGPAATSTSAGTSTTPTKVVTVTVTTPASSTATGGSGSGYSGSGSSGSGSSSSGTTDSSNASGSSSSTGSSASGSSGSTGSSASSATDDAATVETDKVQVAEDKVTVKADEEAVKETKLYAPVAGTIASLSSDSIGTEEGSSSSSSDSSSSSSSSSSSTGGSVTAGSLGGSSSSSSSSSSGFAEIVNTDTLTMTVAFSESDINEIKVGQAATVSISALSGVELAGKITAISPTGTSDNDVVSYDATITIDQTTAKVKAGMTATADVVIESQSGVTVPSDAVSGDTVDVIKNGKVTPTTVTVGLKGTSRDVITSGLSAGEELQVTETLPSLGSSTSTTSSSSSSSGTSGFSRAGAAAGGFGGAGGFPGGGSFGG